MEAIDPVKIFGDLFCVLIVKDGEVTSQIGCGLEFYRAARRAAGFNGLGKGPGESRAVIRRMEVIVGKRVKPTRRWRVSRNIWTRSSGGLEWCAETHDGRKRIEFGTKKEALAFVTHPENR